MRIALDYCEAADPTRAGKGEYVFLLTAALATAAPDIKLVLLVAKDQHPNPPAPNCEIVHMPARRGALWQIFALVWLTFASRIDLYFSTTSVIVPALLVGRPVVTTIFDFTSWRFPATHNTHAQRIEKLFMKLALVRSKALLAISEFTKQEAVNIFGVPAQKITVSPLAVSSQFTDSRPPTAEAVAKVRRKYHLPQHYILCLATIEPRKNMTAAITAFASLRAEFPDLHLVLAGGQGWYSKQILSAAGEHVIVTGYIDDTDRPAVYSGASLFVFPSLYEGFGMPPLEAMAMATPTIVSNRASLPEVAGSVAVQIALEEPDGLSRAMQEVLRWPIKQKKDWQQRAVAWARTFSWQQTARITLDVLKASL